MENTNTETTTVDTEIKDGASAADETTREDVDTVTMSKTDYDKAIQSAEDKIRGHYSKELKDLKDKIKELIGDDQVFVDADIDPVDFYKALFGKFDYVDNGVEIDGDAGKVKLTVTALDLDKAMETFGGHLRDYMNSDQAIDDFTNKGEKGLMNAMFTMMIEDFNATDTKTADVVLPIVKNDDGEWDLDMTDDEVGSALFAGSDLDKVFDLDALMEE